MLYNTRYSCLRDTHTRDKHVSKMRQNPLLASFALTHLYMLLALAVFVAAAAASTCTFQTSTLSIITGNVLSQCALSGNATGCVGFFTG